MMTINVPFRNRTHGNCDVRVDSTFWEHGDTKTKQWEVLGVPNEKNVANYVVCGDIRHPEYMHVNVYAFFHPKQTKCIQDKSNQVDHVNSDPTDNQIQSLRLITRAQNISARRGRRDSTSEYKGVGLKKRKKTATSKAADKWICQFKDKTCMTKCIRTQGLPTQYDAARLYNTFVRHFQPECGFQNVVSDNDGEFPDSQINALFNDMVQKHRDGGFLLRS